MTQRKARVIVEGYGEFVTNIGTNLGIFLASKNLLILPCNGQGLCGQCRVYVEGKVSEPTGNEILRGLKDNYRLACQVKILGDVKVRILQKPGIKFSKASLNISLKKIKPLFKIARSDELRNKHDLILLTNNLRFMDKYFISFKNIVLASRRELESFRILLIDLGTTKIAYQVVNDNGNVLLEDMIFNPLNIYGMDIISRLVKAYEDEKTYLSMQKTLLDKIIEIVKNNHVIAAIVAGNSAMESILLGLPIGQLIEKPYQPYVKGPFIKLVSVKEATIPILVMPMISGFVGGDAFSNIIASEYLNTPTPYMIIDLGTNTEVVLVANRDEPRIYATSAPAGPAFEGYIRSGASVYTGGITHVEITGFRIDKPAFKYEGEPIGIMGSGIVSLVAELLRHGLIDKYGRIVKGYEIVNNSKGFIIADTRGYRIVFTQRDLREFQKAVAAVKAAWRILLNKAGIEPNELKTVYLCGLFGSSIKPDDVLITGLIPPVEKKKIVIAGDMVLSGLRIAVLDEEYYDYALGLLRKIRHVNLAKENNFMKIWVDSLRFENP